MDKIVRGLAAACWWIVLTGGPALGQDGPRPCLPQDPDRVQDVTARGELALARGGLTALAGIRLPDEPRSRDKSLAWLRQYIGHPVWTTERSERDRWGRSPVRLTVGDRGTCLDLAHGLVQGGLALVDPGPQGIFSPDLQALETAARKGGLGLWAEDRYKALPVGQVDRLRERIGRFVLIQGRVRSVGERRARTYLNFGSDWTNDFTLIIPRKTWIAMGERGLTAATLKGRQIRARGILEDWQGPALTVTVPEMIEALDNERRRR